MLLSLLWAQSAHVAAVAAAAFTGQTVLTPPAEQHQPEASTQNVLPPFPQFAFGECWQILGPFQIGTRETPWSSDSLEFEGGFHNLEYDVNARYRSALAFNGSVFWLNQTAMVSEPDPDYSRAKLHIDFFPTIDWPFLQEVYGWPGHQWLGWARGQIFVEAEGTKTLNLFLNNVIEYWIDDTRHFGGDFYGEHRAPVTLHLDPGVHTIEVKLVGDVRSAGGLGTPTVNATLELRNSSPELQLVYHGDEGVLISDVVGGDFGPLASPYGAVTVRNDAHDTIWVHGIEGMHNVCKIETLDKGPLKVVPGQTRPIGFRIGCIASYHKRITLHIKYQIEGEHGHRDLSVTTWPNIIRDMDVTHKFTYLHPSGTVDWGILRPPKLWARCGESNNASIPVMPALHGAGTRADDYPLVHMFDPLPDLCAWIVLPQASTGWSGDDWHNWGFGDVEAAIAAIPDWIQQVGWKGPDVDIDKWLMTGHSNGGQGVWYAITHRPDKIIAAAALSGYSSIQNYVPYSSWRTVDPARGAIMQSSLSAYRHDLLIDNTKDIPLIIQHGSKDDNVPAYHSRLMNLRIFEGGGDVTYFEIPDRPHFWEGVGTTKPLRIFFEKHLDKAIKADAAKPQGAPLNLRSFSIDVADPGGMGSKYGVKVLQLQRPGQMGHMDFEFDAVTWECLFHTSNIESFDLPKPFDVCDAFVIDDEEIVASASNQRRGRWLKTIDGWVNADDTLSHAGKPPPTLGPRMGRQLGQMDAILRTHGTFQIVQHSKDVDHIVVQTSRNFAQYFAADTMITANYTEALAATGNVVSVAVGGDLPDCLHADFPITMSDSAITIRYRDSKFRYKERARLQLAAAFLRPLDGERLELVLWGIDRKSLELAARLIPIMTGSGQPDWVVMDETMLWKGLDGTMALGFFDSTWSISSNSYFT